MRATSEEIAIFVAVVESGSFSRAAEQLGQANSAVSRAVKSWNQSRRKPAQSDHPPAQPDRRRRALLSPYAGGLAGNGGGRERSAGDAHDAAGLLRVDAATPVMLHFLMPLVKPFRERYPEMTLSLVSSETFINLIERKVDVAIRRDLNGFQPARPTAVYQLS